MALEFFKTREKKPETKEEIVHDIEKARTMAEAEDPDREFLARFKEYVADPVEFRAAERARIEEAASKDFIMRDESDDFMYLYQEGVRADDLEALAEMAGETESVRYGRNKNIHTMPSLALKTLKVAMQWWLNRISKALDTAYERAGSKIDLSRDPRGILVAEKLQRLRMGDDEHVLKYLDLYDTYQALHRQLEHIEDELKKRSGDSMHIAV